MGLFSLVGGILGGNSQKKAAKAAADAQVKAAQLSIDEQRRQFDITQDNFAPYLGAGTSALGGINALLGISTPTTTTTDWGAYAAANPDIAAAYNSPKSKVDKSRFPTLEDYGRWHYQTYGQAEGRDISPYSTTVGGEVDQGAAINELRNSPLYQSLYRNGEEAILANGSATGGLRGGNMQRSLYNLGADTLSNVIQQQLSNLGGIANMGQGTAGQLGTFGANMAGQIGNQLNNQGTARAQSALTIGGINAGNWNNAGNFLDSAVSAFIPGGGGIKALL